MLTGFERRIQSLTKYCPLFIFLALSYHFRANGFLASSTEVKFPSLHFVFVFVVSFKFFGDSLENFSFFPLIFLFVRFHIVKLFSLLPYSSSVLLTANLIGWFFSPPCLSFLTPTAGL